jgi:hypothetical protein
MTRFYFHIKDKKKTVIDDIGIELQDLDAVREEAILSAREVMSQQVLSGKRRDGQSFVVTDDQGDIVLTFPFRLALKE